MIEFKNENEHIRFSVRGYQYPDQKTITNEYDANWLMISYSLKLKNRQWERLDPSLLIWEMRDLSNWLKKLKSDNPNPVSKELNFTEPNVSFLLFKRTKDAVTLRVFVDAELKHDGNDAREFLECTLDQRALSEVIGSIKVELANFPQRDCNYF